MGGRLLRDLLTQHLAGWISSSTASSLVLTAVLLVFVGFLPLVRMEGQEAWGARADHQYVRQFLEMIPRRSIVLTQIPSMLLVEGQGAIQTYVAIQDPALVEHLIHKYNGQVYFHYNFWCNTDSKDQTSLCQQVRERFHLEEIALMREQDYEFGLYQIHLK